MVIFHSYVSSPEGKQTKKLTIHGSRQGAACVKTLEELGPVDFVLCHSVLRAWAAGLGENG